MGRLFAAIGSIAGGWVGWAAGARVGFMTAYMVSIVGTAVGVYYGRRLADIMLD
jgi:phage tail tape-measure protein